jgi:hypothetical protein
MRLVVPRRNTTHEYGSHHRNRVHLPEVHCLSAKSDMPIVNVTAYLTATLRSQGFSPSQRFDPGTPLRLCFAPHPLVGFRPSELLPPEPAVTPHDAHCSHAIRRTLSSTTSWRDKHTRQSTSRMQALTSERCSGLVSDTPQDSGLPCGAAALLAFVLSEVYQPVDRPVNGSTLMHLSTD